jgi:signal transduction histidine kinase
MLGSIFIDLAFWTSKAHLGDFSQLGSLVGIGFFSMGLGKKNRIIEKEKKEVQKSYVEQLQINSRLVKDQRDKLEKKVNDRTIALLQAKEEAERNAKAKEEFLSVMSHEIRTPMNAIVGLTHMLPTKNQDKEFVENLTTLRYSVDNLMLLINNVLDYNKISAGKVQLESVDFSLKMIVNSVCHLFKSKADSKGLDFLIHVDEKLPQAINGDPFRLSQILNNFLSNAIKFTEKGAITISVKGRRRKC